MPSTPDYYATLNIAPTASSTQIREAYKRAALKHHPDRVSTTDPSRASRTKKFQEINDAYYVLSDPTRRRDYDATRSANTHHSDSRWQDDQFADIFEDMMREAGMNEDGTPRQQDGKGSVWSMVGGLGGAAIGFIVGNFPGMLAGAVAGNRLGAVRDRKGKSVYEAFQELPQGDRAKLLGELAAKFLAHAVS